MLGNIHSFLRMLQFYPLTELVHHIPKIKKVNQTLSNVHTYKTELASAIKRNQDLKPKDFFWRGGFIQEQLFKCGSPEKIRFNIAID